MKILIIDDQPTILEVYHRVLEGTGHAIETAADGEQGLAAFARFAPDLVLADIEMPCRDGLAVLAEIRKVSDEAIVVMQTGARNVEYVLRALKMRANDYLEKPVRAAELRRLAEKYAAIVSGRLVRSDLSTMLSSDKSILHLDNRLSLIHPAITWMLEQTAGLFPPSDHLGLRLGLTEVLINAIEHGNLGIDFDEKTRAIDEGTEGWLHLIEQRAATPPFCERRVEVRFHPTATGCEWLVSDQGDGFAWRDLPDVTSEERIFSTHGRGIFLARLQFDEFEHLGRGNQIRMVKRANPTA